MVLVVGPSWVGDMVMAQSLFRVLKQRDPELGIQVLAPSWARPLLERMPEVEAAIPLPIGHGKLALKQRKEIARRLKLRRFNRSIVLPNSWKSALIPYFAEIPLRTGWLGEYRYWLLNDIRYRPKKLPMMVQRFIALGIPAGESPPERIPIPRLDIQTFQVEKTLRRLGLNKNPHRPMLALCPGAEYGPAKQWPVESFGEVARAHHEQGWLVWLFGSRRDKEICTAVNTNSGNICLDLSGRTGLEQAIDLLSLATSVVSNDSGLMHIAAAIGRPVVGLFGSSDPAHTPPLSNRARILSLNLKCSPCFKRECPLGHLNCLKQISVQQVLDALTDICGE
ncbi:ADP-heptose--LPS heptosyltransferase [Achromatium sp. WMS1]|nr:ADP-heptose--LPS heptosyltransferase [Achromatium sp. WMS1]